MPISYAVGYALSQDFEQATMRELFRYADKNMYIDKNRAKIFICKMFFQIINLKLRPYSLSCRVSSQFTNNLFYRSGIASIFCKKKFTTGT